MSTKTGCTPEVAGDAALLVNPYDYTEIAEAMRKVLSDEAMRTKLIDKGLERIGHFGWGKCAGETLKLFEAVFDGSHVA